MAQSRLTATCAAVFLSLTFVSAQVTPEGSRRHHDTRPDPTPSATIDAAKAPQVATLSGCVVRDAVNGGKATIKSNGIWYKLTARNDQDFAQYLGKKVEVTGALTTSQSEQRATSGKTDPEVRGTSKDAIPLATDRGTTADLTGRMDVKTIKTVAGSCL